MLRAFLALVFPGGLPEPIDVLPVSRGQGRIAGQPCVVRVVVGVWLGVLLVTWMYALVKELRRVGVRPREAFEPFEELV